MILKLNPTGTHIQQGFLKVRIDVYPEPHEKTYSIHYVDEVDEDGNLTGFKQLNPCLCHFVIINKDTTELELVTIVNQIFDAETKQSLDDSLSTGNMTGVQRIMTKKCGSGGKVTLSTRKVKRLIENLNKQFASLKVSIGY